MASTAADGGHLLPGLLQAYFCRCGVLGQREGALATSGKEASLCSIITEGERVFDLGNSSRAAVTRRSAMEGGWRARGAAWAAAEMERSQTRRKLDANI